MGLPNPFEYLGNSISNSAFGQNPYGFMTGGFNNDLWNPIDFLLPGTSLLNTMFDPTGQRAAATAYQQNLALQHDAQDFNAKQALLQREYETRMSNTAYQRAAADMRAAGINPAAMFMQNGGSASASTPSGSSATSSANSSPMASNKLAVAAGLIATALRMFLTKH